MGEEQRWRPCDGKVAARWAAHTAHPPAAAKCASHVALYLVRRNHHFPPQQSPLSLSTWPPICGLLHLAPPPACDSTLLTISHPLPCPFSHNILTNLTNTNITSISTSVCDPFVLLCELVKICEALSQVTGPCVV